jgi:hypothetical protein
MTAQFHRRLARLEASGNGAERLTVIVRTLAPGPRQGEVFRVCDLLAGRSWTRTDNETAQGFHQRIEAQHGPSINKEQA